MCVKALYTGDLRYKWGDQKLPLFNFNEKTLEFEFELDEDIKYSLESVIVDDDFILLDYIASDDEEDSRIRTVSKDELISELIGDNKIKIIAINN